MGGFLQPMHLVVLAIMAVLFYLVNCNQRDFYSLRTKVCTNIADLASVKRSAAVHIALASKRTEREAETSQSPIRL